MRPVSYLWHFSTSPCIYLSLQSVHRDLTDIKTKTKTLKMRKLFMKTFVGRTGCRINECVSYYLEEGGLNISFLKKSLLLNFFRLWSCEFDLK